MEVCVGWGAVFISFIFDPFVRMTALHTLFLSQLYELAHPDYLTSSCVSCVLSEVD